MPEQPTRDRQTLRSIFVIVLMGIILGITAAYFSETAQYGAIIAAIVTIACLIINIHPFHIILLFICWLPVQNFALMFLSGLVGVPDIIIRGGLVSKEIIALIVFGYLILSSRVTISRFRSVDYAILAYFLWTSLYFIIPNSVFPIPSGMVGRVMGYRAAIVPAALYFIGRFIPFDKNKLVFSIKLIMFTAVCVSVFGIVERFFIPDSFWTKAGISHFWELKGSLIPGELPGNFFGFFGGRWIRRAVSTYGDPLTFGFANIFVIALVLYFIYRRRIGVLKSPLRRLCVFSMVGIAQLLTITRAAILANLMGMGLLFLYLKKMRIRIMLISVIIFLLFVPFMLTLGPLLQRIYHQTLALSDPSSQGHIRALYLGAKNILTHPMGFGLGQGGYVGRVFGTGLAGESLYFTIMVERGIVGLFLFSLAIILLVTFCHKNIKYLGEDPILKGLTYVIIVSTVGYALASLTTEHWQAFVSSGIYWIYAGIVVQIIDKFRRAKRKI